MDSLSWHHHCVSADVAEPKALTLRQWNKLTDAQRTKHIECLEAWRARLFVLTDELKEICEVLSETVNENRRTRPGAKQIVVVTGVNLSGKSTLMTYWARLCYLDLIAASDVDDRGLPVIYPTDDSDADYCPVVWVDLPPKAQINSTCFVVLECYSPYLASDLKNLPSAVTRAAKQHQTQVMIFDDVHLLWTDWKGGRGVLDLVKVINTGLGRLDWGATLVLVGANLGDSDLVRDPQIEGRLTLREVPTYGVDENSSHADFQRWQRVVRQLEQMVLPHLPAGKPGMLYMDLVGPLADRTQGYLGDLVQLVGKAMIVASKDGAHRILKKHLDCVELSERAQTEYQKLLAARRRRSGKRDGAVNPLAAEFDAVRFRESG